MQTLHVLGIFDLLLLSLLLLPLPRPPSLGKCQGKDRNGWTTDRSGVCSLVTSRSRKTYMSGVRVEEGNRIDRSTVVHTAREHLLLCTLLLTGGLFGEGENESVEGGLTLCACFVQWFCFG